MPKKSVREMSKVEKVHYSLSTRVFHASIMGSIALGIVALLIGLGLYTFALANQYISEAFNLARSVAGIIEKVVYVEPVSDYVLNTYKNLSEEERAQKGTEQYNAHFSLVQSDSNYQTILAVLENFCESSDVNDLYLGMYLEEPSELVYIADPETDEGSTRYPGDWEAVRPEESKRFLTWDGSGKLYDAVPEKNYGWMCTAGVPLKNKDGEIIAFVLADITMREVASGIRSFLIQFVTAMLIVVNLVGFLLSRRMKKTVVTPINEIADAAHRYVKDRRDGVQTTDHFDMLNIRTGDEIENLSLVMADMERDLSDYMENLTKVTAEKERIGTELSLATKIQADTLPSIFPPFPGRSEFDIYAMMKPAKEVGGDFYDFFLIDEDHLGLAIADVSGKGVPAAMLMMIAKILVQNYALMGESPGSVLEHVNSQICSNNREEMFVTVWFGILDVKTGKVTACNAGHEYPMLKKPGGKFEIMKDSHSFVLGGMREIRCKEYEFQMDPGAALFLYTDGIPEATNTQDEMFGIGRTLEVLNEMPEDTPQKLQQRVREAVETFAGSAPQFDDMTMLGLYYKGKVS